MITKRGRGDFSRAYRPCRISEVYGQEEIKRIIGRGLDEKTLPNSMLFFGESGVGKTTMGRIIAMGLNCRISSPTSEPCCECDSCRCVKSDSHLAFQQFNSADVTGVEYLREASQHFICYPIDGSQYRIIIFDECHRLSRNAQDFLLKVIEDGHPDNYFILCSSEPKSIIDTLKNRCMPIEFKRISDDQILRLLTDVCKSEGILCDDSILKGITEEAQGKARNALFLLQRAASAGEIERLPSLVEQTINQIRVAFGR